MNLAEMKRSAQCHIEMDRVYNKIKDAYTNRVAEVTFERTSEPNPNSSAELSAIQVDILTDRGYSVEWNDNRERYVVKGW